MYKSIFSSLAILASFALQAAPALPSNGGDNLAPITLRAGTNISLTLNEPVDDTWQVGNSLDFFVRSNVTVNGKVAIAAGSTATGWIKSVKSGCNGQCSEITIEVNSAQAVDGQTVNLRAIPHVIKAPCCNGQASGNIGSNLSARVLNDITLDL